MIVIALYFYHHIYSWEEICVMKKLMCALWWDRGCVQEQSYLGARNSGMALSPSSLHPC